jgi:hypothetical protein
MTWKQPPSIAASSELGRGGDRGRRRCVFSPVAAGDCRKGTRPAGTQALFVIAASAASVVQAVKRIVSGSGSVCHEWKRIGWVSTKHFRILIYNLCSPCLQFGMERVYWLR